VTGVLFKERVQPIKETWNVDLSKLPSLEMPERYENEALEAYMNRVLPQCLYYQNLSNQLIMVQK